MSGLSPLGTWALVLAFVGPLAVLALTAILGAALTLGGGLPALAYLAPVAMGLLAILAFLVIGMAMVGVRLERPGRTAAIIALVIAGVGLVALVWFGWIPWAKAMIP
jgi:hypothetical protein